MSTPRLGVVLFSLGGLHWHRRLDLPGAVAAVAGLGPDQGVELIGAQSLRSYPAVSDEEVRVFRDAVERTGVVPVAYGAYLERARSRSRVLTPAEAVDLLEPEIAVARRLGFGTVRVNAATPEVLRLLAPLAERTGVDLVVELAAEPRSDPPTAALVAELDRLACPRLGLVQDFSAFVRAVPQPFLDDAVAGGAPPSAVGTVAAVRADGRPVDEAVQAVLGLPGLTPAERGLGVQTAHITYALFRTGAPEGLADVLPHLRHVQAKFFAVDDAGAEPCIPYPELVGVLREGGWTGRVHSEFEGFLWSDDLDALDQLRRHQAGLRRLYAA